MKERKCEDCGANLTEEDVMKLKVDNGSWYVIPLPVCPNCLAKRMSQRAHSC